MSKRAPLKCSCGRAYKRLCAAPLSGAKRGATCGVRLCDGCGVKQGDGTALCIPHNDIAKKENSK